MSVVAIAPYEFTPRDVRENFPAPLLYIGWEDHLMFCAPVCLPLPPDTPFRAEMLAAHEAAVRERRPGYLDPVSGLFVLTAATHLTRGTCCGNGCRHCPYV